MEGIYNGSYYRSPALWKSEEREQELLFSDPYLENQLIIVGRKGANVVFTSISELEQKRIGLVRDYVIEQFNAEIKKMINEGLYNELLGLGCVRADIDGDGTLEIVLNCDAAGTEPPEGADSYNYGMTIKF